LHEFHSNQISSPFWAYNELALLHHHTSVVTGIFAQQYIVALDYITNVSRLPIRILLVRVHSSLPSRRRSFWPTRCRFMSNMMLRKAEKLKIRK